MSVAQTEDQTQQEHKLRKCSGILCTFWTLGWEAGQFSFQKLILTLIYGSSMLLPFQSKTV